MDELVKGSGSGVARVVRSLEMLSEPPGRGSESSMELVARAPPQSSAKNMPCRSLFRRRSWRSLICNADKLQFYLDNLVLSEDVVEEDDLDGVTAWWKCKRGGAAIAKP
mmetsp:Transcript_28452/g.61531  ORF Transcript_28452/g.61531 Transcript_28452/m.61531 type:complete len:109 (-) Transcript_28452:170-496(-)